MQRLDTKYLANLVIKSQAGNSNAFAELFTATYQEEYAYAYKNLLDENLAKAALKDTYGRALKEINKLTEPELVLAWLYRLNFQVCQERKNKLSDEPIDESMLINGQVYYVAQLSKNLPMTEAQVLIMRYYQDYSLREIGLLLGITNRTIRQNIKGGCAHLMQLTRQ